MSTATVSRPETTFNSGRLAVIRHQTSTVPQPAHRPTPKQIARARFLRLKRQTDGALVMFDIGGYYHFYFEDAVTVGDVLGLPYEHPGRPEQVSIQKAHIDKYLPFVRAAGYMDIWSTDENSAVRPADHIGTDLPSIN